VLKPEPGDVEGVCVATGNRERYSHWRIYCEDDGMGTVLVTGGSASLAVMPSSASWPRAIRCARRPHSARESDVRAMPEARRADVGDRLSFVAAISTGRGLDGCARRVRPRAARRVAFPMSIPNTRRVIVPAREGALRVLRAARDAGVTRVVLTSSFAAIGYGHPPQAAPSIETSWTNLDGDDVHAYVKSKTMAERAAWTLSPAKADSRAVRRQPGGVFGPVLGPDYSTSILIRAASDGRRHARHASNSVRRGRRPRRRRPAHPRDDASCRQGERFLAVAGDFVPMREIAAMLKKRLGASARRVPTRQLPDWLVRLAALWIRASKQVVPELGKRKNATNEKARRLLGWTPRSSEEAVAATVKAWCASDS